MLPKDPIMLLSVINTRLRDYYSSFAVFCREEGIGEQEAARIIETLAGVGYEYDADRNQFG
ncbi:MAG: DUF4250 domain-containing protein [Eubacteriales bacterium]|nr:DUF4250 domain-containing protein [Eubacteriales bacterium]